MRRLAAIVVGLAPSVAWAVPGPDSVAIVANANVEGSVRLAERYRAARGVPRDRVCALDLAETHTIPLADFREDLEAPLLACLGDTWADIDTIVLVRGVPQRVTLPGGRASLAAVLAVSGSKTSTGADFIGQPPGMQVSCGGNPCLSGAWANPYRGGPFEPGFTETRQGVAWSLRLVTALDGRSDADVERLIASATTADALGGADGEFMLMDGADNARGVLDREYAAVVAALNARGFDDVSRPAFSRDETGHDLAAFFVGTAALDTTIEGNTFRPGAIVDNLTSLGAVPPNFAAPEDERQVSIARWVARGVAGVHGATDEPLNNCFPSRQLLVDYVDGYTLAEAYLGRMPFVYWRNLVLGDPMTAPYAERPVVEFVAIEDGATVTGAVELGVVVTPAPGAPVESLTLYVNGARVERTNEAFIARCQTWDAEGETHLLAVAQNVDAPRTKGWASITIDVTAGREDCTSTPDAGVVDAGSARDGGAAEPTRDAGPAEAPPPLEEAGCACSSAEGESGGVGVLVAALAFVVGGRRRRRSVGARSK